MAEIQVTLLDLNIIMIIGMLIEAHIIIIHMDIINMMLLFKVVNLLQSLIQEFLVNLLKLKKQKEIK
jgi:hypothetical protein